MWKSKDIYYISDSTGVLAINLGQSLICQFPEINFHEEKFPFIKTAAEAQSTLEYILQRSSGRLPIIFSTLVEPKIRNIFDHPQVELFDVCEVFLGRLENCLEAKALMMPGFARQLDDVSMARRVEAINYCLSHDDGTKLDEYNEADVLILGVSRAGKTPVSVYLSSNMGLKAANYPLTNSELDRYFLPEDVSRNRKKAVGLTTSPELLSSMRQKRYPNSNYARRSACIQELEQAKQIFLKYNIPVIDTAGKSIEEIAAQISQEIGLYKKSNQLR
ncbi:MAG: pyruvate, phosphate dikinase/phosphoenolpyruvate synthase regulator [Deltaproteobacteria bacterium]|nr:pyruvate, phosphate dikinase/phosphoenolpyruvate synthase regulator [Deltaproteobacteria bacterium]